MNMKDNPTDTGSVSNSSGINGEDKLERRHARDIPILEDDDADLTTKEDGWGGKEWLCTWRWVPGSWFARNVLSVN